MSGRGAGGGSWPLALVPRATLHQTDSCAGSRNSLTCSSAMVCFGTDTKAKSFPQTIYSQPFPGINFSVAYSDTP